MNSKDFIQACEDGKLLVWGQKGLRTVRKNKDSKLIAYLDLETGVAFICEHLEQAGEGSVCTVRFFSNREKRQNPKPANKNPLAACRIESHAGKRR